MTVTHPGEIQSVFANLETQSGLSITLERNGAPVVIDVPLN